MIKNNIPVIIVAGMIICLGFYIYSADTIFADNEDDYDVELFSVIDTAYDPFDSQAMMGIYRINKKDKIKAHINHVKAEHVDELAYMMNISANKANLIFCIGYSMKDSELGSARANPNVNYLTVDIDYDEGELPPNMADIVFRSNEPSYVAGYVAGMTTKTNKIGFIGGIDNYVMHKFYYGYLAGINRAEKERGVSIKVLSSYVGDFSNADKAAELAEDMYNEGADIIYSVAGGAGFGIIETAEKMNKYVIGVDVDQNYIAPENVIFSVVKDVATATESIIEDYANGMNYGGQIISMGYKEDSVRVVTYIEVIDDDVIKTANKLEEAIRNGELIVPKDEYEYNLFKARGY